DDEVGGAEVGLVVGAEAEADAAGADVLAERGELLGEFLLAEEVGEGDAGALAEEPSRDAEPAAEAAEAHHDHALPGQILRHGVMRAGPFLEPSGGNPKTQRGAAVAMGWNAVVAEHAERGERFQRSGARDRPGVGWGACLDA